MTSWWMCVVAALAACGASNAEIKTAKTAIYVAQPDQLLQIAMRTAEENYKIGELDKDAHMFATAPRIYSPEGDLQSPGAGDFVRMDNHSVRVSLVVRIVDVDGGELVTVTPNTLQFLSGSPKPRELTPDDPNLPPFVKGRAEALAVAIYDAARPLLAQPPPASAK